MKLISFAVAAILSATGLTVVAGCSSSSDNPGNTNIQSDSGSDTQQQGDGAAPAAPNLASGYCFDLGYTLGVESSNEGESGNCIFPDGTSCANWDFFRGKCGQAFSFCNLHGGSISNRLANMGTWIADYAVCTLNGVECDELTFFKTGTCDTNMFSQFSQ